jgi:hypothetical protein
MTAGRELPAVTKNKNYPQPVKHLKPMALSPEPPSEEIRWKFLVQNDAHPLLR